MSNSLTDTYMAYQFIKRLNTPFQNWDAFKLGVIDDTGHALIKRSLLTQEQRNTWGRFDVLVANLKRLLAKLPGGSTKLATIAATVLLLKETELDENDVDMIAESLDNYYVAIKECSVVEEQTMNLLEARKNPGGKLCKCSGDLHTIKLKMDDEGSWNKVRECSNCHHQTIVRKKAPTQKQKDKKAQHQATLDWLLKEDDMDSKNLLEGIKRPIKEDAPVNAVGGGQVAGVGVGPKGEPGKAPPGKKKKPGELPSTNLMSRITKTGIGF